MESADSFILTILLIVIILPIPAVLLPRSERRACSYVAFDRRNFHYWQPLTKRVAKQAARSDSANSEELSEATANRPHFIYSSQTTIDS
jgi:hypothetical protein